MNLGADGMNGWVCLLLAVASAEPNGNVRFGAPFREQGKAA